MKIPDLQSPLVTVVLPVFNRRHLVERAINSVLAQHECNWELLIVDDGSTDGLEHIVLKKVMTDARIRYLKHANRKLAASRNIGIFAALGKYVTFLDSDDEYHSDHLYRRIKYMQENPKVDLIHGGVELIGPEQSHYVMDAFRPGEKIHLSQCIIGATLFAEKRVFVEVNGFALVSYSAESDLISRMEDHYCIHRISLPTYRYYTGLEDSICTKRIADEA